MAARKGRTRKWMEMGILEIDSARQMDADSSTSKLPGCASFGNAELGRLPGTLEQGVRMAFKIIPERREEGGRAETPSFTP